MSKDIINTIKDLKIRDIKEDPKRIKNNMLDMAVEMSEVMKTCEVQNKVLSKRNDLLCSQQEEITKLKLKYTKERRCHLCLIVYLAICGIVALSIALSFLNLFVQIGLGLAFIINTLIYIK